MHIMIKNKLLLMKNIFTKQFRHFFLILFAVLLILQLLGSGTFIITKTKQLLFRIYYELPYINILLFQNLFLQLFISSAAAFITAIL